jgi:hypothetical protein
MAFRAMERSSRYQEVDQKRHVFVQENTRFSATEKKMTCSDLGQSEGPALFGRPLFPTKIRD